MRDRYGEAESRAAVPRLRHDLLGDPGPAGRGAALLAREPLDLMVVIGGYNSSNTCKLARICADRVPTYHIADPEPGWSRSIEIRHKPVDGQAEECRDELAPAGRLPSV